VKGIRWSKQTPPEQLRAEAQFFLTKRGGIKMRSYDNAYQDAARSRIYRHGAAIVTLIAALAFAFIL
jgi:hypothetical protein